MLTWPCFCVRYRGSARPAVTGGITVTPTSPARWTRKTSAASSVTVATSYSGCTCGSTSSCDGRQPRTHSTFLPAYLPLPLRQMPQTSKQQENDQLKTFKNKLHQLQIKDHPGLPDELGFAFNLKGWSRLEPLLFLFICLTAQNIENCGRE